MSFEQRVIFECTEHSQNPNSQRRLCLHASGEENSRCQWSGVSHLLHGDSVDGEGEKRVSLGLAVGVTGVDEGAVAWLGVGGSGCRNDPAIMAALVELSAVCVMVAHTDLLKSEM